MTRPAPFSRRRFLGTATAGLALPALPRLARAQSSAALQLSWQHSVQFAGSYIAQDRGFWSEQDLEVTLLPGGPNAPVEPPVVSGTALIGISAADYTAAAVEQGAPFRILGVAMQKNPFVIASLPDNPVAQPADLMGKRIGMALANTPVLQALCTLNDVDIDRIEVVPTQYSAQPLLAGEVDCLLCWETDLPVAMAMQGIAAQTMLMADHGYALHSQTYIATLDSLANRRAELVALLRGELRGWEAYRQDTAAAAALTLQMYPDAGLDLPTQELQAERQVPLMFSESTDEHGFGWWSDAAVEDNIATLALLGRTVTPDLWDRSILEEVHGS
ncbi:ABC transporter substrate-binding protein [Salipiger marinus]|uniref:Thiamine pyrimidine synthase n=1 Tax=Salipiger marinus TaxID=555512 RepID=A0A1G8PHW8_9RHOB|nr:MULTISPECIES: ABC transporter substrate-binding protein [Salipiger]MCD1618829.1 ABC transporter substrate-binding protein [Salipiger manganoxidans]MEB3419740.1 ABC transporter substrate-binding protein [Salipiger manganoxidans]SDI91898.1 ABC-type nitrate/sulfonate/bicarbonate transport system, substrate-binding protein [Salipiger marinus]